MLQLDQIAKHGQRENDEWGSKMEWTIRKVDQVTQRSYLKIELDFTFNTNFAEICNQGLFVSLDDQELYDRATDFGSIYNCLSCDMIIYGSAKLSIPESHIVSTGKIMDLVIDTLDCKVDYCDGNTIGRCTDLNYTKDEQQKILNEVRHSIKYLSFASIFEEYFRLEYKGD